jgi:hypothetical protein
MLGELAGLEDSSNWHRTPKHHEAAHTPPLLLTSSPIRQYHTSFLSLATVPTEMHVQNHSTSTVFVVDRCRSIENVGAEVGVLLRYSLVAVKKVDGASSDGIVEFVADFGG